MLVRPLVIPESTVGKGGLHASHLIVQRPEPIGSALEDCLISWCIISGCLLCQFVIGATPSSQFRGPFCDHRIAMGTFIGSLTTSTSITLTDSNRTHSPYLRTMPLTHTYISSTVVSNMVHSRLFSISCCNIRGLSSDLNSVHITFSLQTLMHSSSPKLKSNRLTQMTTPFSPLIQNALDMSFFPLFP